MAPRFLALVVLCFPASAYDQRDAKLQDIVYAHYEIQAEAKGQGSPKETTNATAPAHSAKGAHSVEGGAFDAPIHVNDQHAIAAALDDDDDDDDEILQDAPAM